MAAIGKIRENSTLLLIVIGGAMVAFVLGDLFSGGAGMPADQYVGQVAGEEINIMAYEQRVSEEQESRSSTGQPMNEQVQESIRNQVWNQMVMDKILSEQIEKVGLRLTKEEYDDLRFGANVDASILNDPTFQNPETGMFDPEMVRRYYSFIQTSYPVFHKVQQNRMINDRLYEKYNNLVKKGLYANYVEAKDKYIRDNKKINFRYVVKRYDSVADTTLEISESELKSFYKKNKDSEKYNIPASADIQYVVFDVNITPEDEEVALERMEPLVEDFRNTKNDSIFIDKNSRVKRFTTQDYVRGATSEEMDNAVFNAEVGDVVGPFKEGNNVKILKIKGFEDEEQSRARHILLKPNENNTIDELKTRADSLVKVIKRNNNFEEMVSEFSEDPGSVANGGVYEWFNRERMVPEFTEAAFKKEGTISVVETSYGIHIVEVLELRQQPMAKVLVVERPVEPTPATFDDVYDEASDLSINSSDAEDFIANAEERGLEVKTAEKVKADSRAIPGVPGSREVIRWANNPDTKTGKVSEVMEAGNKFIVAVVNKKRESGVAEFEDVRDQVFAEVAKEKKAELFMEELKGSVLSDIANNAGLTVQTASNLSGTNTTLPGGSNEPYIAGVAMTLEQGSMSVPLKGNAGVYVIEITSISEPDTEQDFTFAKDEIIRNAQGRVSTINGQVFNSLRKMADVKDERFKFY